MSCRGVVRAGGSKNSQPIGYCRVCPPRRGKGISPSKSLGHSVSLRESHRRHSRNLAENLTLMAFCCSVPAMRYFATVVAFQLLQSQSNSLTFCVIVARSSVHRTASDHRNTQRRRFLSTIQFKASLGWTAHPRNLVCQSRMASGISCCEVA